MYYNDDLPLMHKFCRVFKSSVLMSAFDFSIEFLKRSRFFYFGWNTIWSSRYYGRGSFHCISNCSNITRVKFHFISEWIRIANCLKKNFHTSGATFFFKITAISFCRLEWWILIDLSLPNKSWKENYNPCKLISLFFHECLLVLWSSLLL